MRMHDQAQLAGSPRGIQCFARYRVKKNITDQDRAILYNNGYKDLFPDDPRRPLYSCDGCYELAGSILPNAWEFSLNGFLRK